MLLSAAVLEFLVALQADGLSPATVKWYRSILRSLVQQHPHDELTSLSAVTLRAYIVKLRDRLTYTDAPQKPRQNRKMALASVDSHVTALHSFWAWCAREYDIPNPMANIRRAPRRSPEVKAISPENFVKLFEATSDRVAGVRDRALLAFLADTGCRLGGVVSLKLDDLDVEGCRALVREKGNKTRTVVFTSITARFLASWLSVRSKRTGYVFTSVVYPHNPLSKDGVEQILKRLKHRAGVTGRVNPHSFRHAFAREYLRRGGDIVTLARLLGHSDVNTTAAYYAVFSQDELAELHEKYSPLRGLLSEVR